MEDAKMHPSTMYNYSVTHRTKTGELTSFKQAMVGHKNAPGLCVFNYVKPVQP